MHTIDPPIEVQHMFLQLMVQLRAIADRDPELAATLMESVCKATGPREVAA